MASKDNKGLSKLISYWLRHHPEDGGIIVDEYGWAAIPDVLTALSHKDNQSTVDTLVYLNTSFDKVRWEIDLINNKMRATHGHSIPIIISNEPSTPPNMLYHGTAITTIEKIKHSGSLLPMGRQFVHLSETKGIATEVAKRHGKPTIIEISTSPLLENGWEFYKTSDNVWLTSAIPTQYLFL